MSRCEPPEFYSEDFPRARKQHPCVECHAPILIGEKHLYYRGKWDGEFNTGRQHMLCREICMELNQESQYWDGTCEIGFGALWEHWREQWQSARRHMQTNHYAEALPVRRKIAQIIWRQRKHRTLRKRISGSLYSKAWGCEWVCIEVHKLREGV